MGDEVSGSVGLNSVDFFRCIPVKNKLSNLNHELSEYVNELGEGFVI